MGSEINYLNDLKSLRKIGKFHDIFSFQKLKNNKNIIKFASKFLHREEEINSIILDGPCIKTTLFFIDLENIKNILIIEGNKKHYSEIKLNLKILKEIKNLRKINIKVIEENIFNFFNKEYLEKLNLIYLDLHTNFFSLTHSKHQTKGGKQIVKQILKNTRMNNLVFAMTFSLRIPLKNLTHEIHCELIESKLEKYFRIYGFKLIERLNNKLDVMYTANSGKGKLYFNVFYLQKFEFL